MAEFLELLETIRAEEASVRRLFSGDGQGVRHHRRQDDPRYLAQLAEAATLIADVLGGKKPRYHLQEAMTTSDFPLLFGDVIDRQLLAKYRETPKTWPAWAKRKTVPDFRTVKRFYVDGGDGTLDIVKMQAEYPEGYVDEGKWEYSVAKYGRRMPFAWETMINDDLDALKDIPDTFGTAARRTEEKFATQFIADANGPHATLYTGGNANIITGNPVLSIAALQTGFQIMAAQLNPGGEPILNSPAVLAVVPALQITAKNILNALQIEITEAGGTSNQKLVALNWMKNELQLVVLPYAPIVITSATKKLTSWWLFANPNEGRGCVEMGFLRGHEEPETFMKSPNARRVGGGDVDVMSGDFDTDSIEYKIRHVMGGTRLDYRYTCASNGSAS